jgi:type IV pilus assembly protein PilX
MKTNPRANSRTIDATHERGIVLFIALIAMIVLSLAGVALIRSVDTTGSVAGNLAFREASIAPINLAIEQAVDALYISKSINPTADDPAHNYYASLRPIATEKANGVPGVLSGTYAAMQLTYPFGAPVPDITTKAEVRWVIERICSAAGLPTIATCDELPPKVSYAKTSMKLKGPTLPPIPLYRVTVRVDLPGTNTVSYAQAMLK